MNGVPRGNRVLLRLVVIALWLGSSAARAAAQRGVGREGAAFLLLPLGAGSVASGQGVADPDASTERLYWNPAGIARAARREAALHHGNFFIGPVNAVALVWPFERAGVVGASVSVLDYGTQEASDGTGAVGQLSQQSYVFSASYAATLRDRASIGVTFKNARFVGNCSGLCPPIATFDVSTSAVDLGVMLRPFRSDDAVIAVAIRHAGMRFQLNDEPQSDPLPSRVQAGVNVRVRAFESQLPQSVLRVSADLIDRLLKPGSVAPRFGASLEWRRIASFRAGYVGGSGEGTGIAAGLGLNTGRVRADLGRTLGGGSGDAANGAVYFSLRGSW